MNIKAFQRGDVLDEIRVFNIEKIRLRNDSNQFEMVDDCF